MLAFMATMAVAQASAVDVDIIPAPVKLVREEGAFTLTQSTKIVASGPTLPIARLLRNRLEPSTGLAFEVVATDSPGAIALHLDEKLAKLGPEGYKLVVSPKGVEVRAPKPAGVFYGVQSFLQLLPPDVFRKAPAKGVKWSAPCVQIEDYPRFGWRGAMMDSSRHFWPKETVLKFLDVMALHKLNSFHWHLTDDPGWRIEIKKYPDLVAKGSQGDYSSLYTNDATRSVNQIPGGYYTQEDVREIVEYAAERYINVVPEIEMPGHSLAATTVYPKLGNGSEVRAAGLKADFWDNVYNVDDATLTFLKGVLDEVMALFPSKFIHIGGDEVDKTPWHTNPQAQARMKQLGLKNEEELQSWFVQQIDHYLTSKGRRLIGWDEILEGGLAQGATVMSWRGVDGGIKAAKANHDVVMAPGTHTYFDHYQSQDTAHEPRAIGGFTNLEHAYSFEPIPAELSAKEAKHVLGAQFQLWAEFISQPKYLEYMAYPRGCALAEVVWSPKSGRTFAEFMGRMRVHAQRLKVLDVNFRPLEKK